MNLDWRKSTLLSRLSGPRLFDRRFFWITFFVAFVVQITFDVIAYDSPSWLWLPVWVGGHLLATAAAIVIRWGFLDSYLTKNPNPFLNIAVAAVLGIVRITFIGYVSFELELQDLFDLPARIIAGALAGSIAFIVIVSFTESSRSFREVSTALAKTQAQLKNLRREVLTSVKQSQLDAQREIQDVIEPKLRQIEKLLAARTMKQQSKDAVSVEIKKLLDGEVKSLSASYKKQTKVLQNPDNFQGVSRASLYSLPDRVAPHMALRPVLASLAVFAQLPFSLYIFEDASWAPIGLLLALLNFLILLFGKELLSTFKPMPVPNAIFALAVVTTIPVAINYPMLLLAGFPAPGNLYTALIGAIALYVSVTFFGLAVVHDYNRDSYLEKLRKNNARIERELALVNQQIWVERRAWALRIHGTVQASLTAAYVRLSKVGKLNAKDVDLIRAHISQARKGLVDSKELFDFGKSIRQIKNAWKGLIEIKVNLQSDAAKLLLTDKWAGVCANEIIKEAVSNCLKHGRAKTATVQFEKCEPGFVRIIVEDDGRGVPRNFKPGLGSQLIDEIAFPWSLTKIPGGTRLEARIPVSRQKVSA